MKKITQTSLKKLLSYDPHSGIFKWNLSVANNVKYGTIAGTMHNQYIIITIKRKRYLAHRLAWLYMLGKFPALTIDHENHIRSDNRWININKEISRMDQTHNSKLNKRNTSGITGVDFNKKNQKWRAHICINKKLKCLGSFSQLEEAIKIRKAAEMEFQYHKNHGRAICAQ